MLNTLVEINYKILVLLVELLVEHFIFVLIHIMEKLNFDYSKIFLCPIKDLIN